MGRKVLTGPIWRPDKNLGIEDLNFKRWKSILAKHLKNPAYLPRPTGAVSGFVKTQDGYNLRYARWKPTKFPGKGTVLLVSGRAEFIEKQYETIADLRALGYEVVSFDWRGQGGSDRLLEDSRRGYIDDFDQYILDFETVINEIALPDCPAPFFVVGHSTGSLVALLAAPRFANRIDRMVLCSPLLGLGRQSVAMPLVRFLSVAFTFFGLGETFMGGGATPSHSRPFGSNRLTSDVTRYGKIQKFVEEFRELSIGGPTAAWVSAAMKAMDMVAEPDFHAQITVPTLLITAGNDRVVNNLAAEWLGLRLRSGKCVTVEGAQHELFQEKDYYREQVFAAIKTYLDRD